jgi:hypothetical protein
MKYVVVWTLAVWVPILVLVSVAQATLTCANPNGCIGIDAGFVTVGLLVIALPFYLIGLVVIAILNRPGSPPPRSRVRASPPGRKQGW